MNNTISNSVMFLLPNSFEAPWTVTCLSPLSMGFPRQEHWSGLPFHSPGQLPDAEIQPASPTLADGFFTSGHLGIPSMVLTKIEVLSQASLCHQRCSHSCDHRWPSEPTGVPLSPSSKKNGMSLSLHFQLDKNHSSFQARWGHMPSPRPITDCFVLT